MLSYSVPVEIQCIEKNNVMSAPATVLVILFILFAESLCGQKRNRMLAIPRDTTYSVPIVYRQIQREFPFAVPAKDSLPFGVKEERNIVYATLPGTPYGKRKLHLDLFSPEAKGIYPAVIMIHGGGWRSGRKEMQVPLAQQISARGYVTACVEYRLSPEALYPAAVHDIKAAIRFLRAHAEEYNIDPGKIAISGCSAGGQLAALAGMTGHIMKFDGNEGYNSYSSGIQAIIDIDGILDFTDPNESAKDNEPARRSAGAYWFGATFKESPDLWIEASPISYAGETTPPMLFINSSFPRFHAGRDSVIGILNAHCIYSEVHTIPGTPHTFWLFHPWFNQTVEYITSFLDKVLKN
jgi:acetyl esterase/lipase